MKCPRDEEKLEKLFEALNVFRKKAEQTLTEQKELDGGGNSTVRLKEMLQNFADHN